MCARERERERERDRERGRESRTDRQTDRQGWGCPPDSTSRTGGGAHPHSLTPLYLFLAHSRSHTQPLSLPLLPGLITCRASRGRDRIVYERYRGASLIRNASHALPPGGNAGGGTGCAHTRTHTRTQRTRTRTRTHTHIHTHTHTRQVEMLVAALDARAVVGLAWAAPVFTPHTTPCTLHPAPYTLYPAPCTLHPTPFTLHPTPNLQPLNPKI